MPKKKGPEPPPEVDIYRDTLVRYLGYANEVGESFRSVIDVRLVYLSYGISSGYVLADTQSKTRKAWADLERDEDRTFKTGATMLDVLLWQSFASVIIPGFTINRICKVARSMFMRSKALCRHAKWYTVVVGLGCIPLIIHPIDHAVDFAMDHTLRPALGIKKKHE